MTDQSLQDNMHYRCFVCNKKIKMYSSNGKFDFNSPPMDAVIFNTTGNYGSKVYDLEPHTEMAVCDSCFSNRTSRMIFVDDTGYHYVSERRKEKNFFSTILDWFFGWTKIKGMFEE